MWFLLLAQLEKKILWPRKHVVVLLSRSEKNFMSEKIRCRTTCSIGEKFLSDEKAVLLLPAPSAKTDVRPKTRLYYLLRRWKIYVEPKTRLYYLHRRWKSTSDEKLSYTTFPDRWEITVRPKTRLYYLPEFSPNRSYDQIVGSITCFVSSKLLARLNTRLYHSFNF